MRLVAVRHSSSDDVYKRELVDVCRQILGAGRSDEDRALAMVRPLDAFTRLACTAIGRVVGP